MEWKKVQSSAETRPVEIDTTSSMVYVYVRKDITSKEVKNEDGSTTLFWEYLECKVLKEVWEIAQFSYANTLKLNDAEDTQGEILLSQTDAQISLDDLDNTVAEILLNII